MQNVVSVWSNLSQGRRLAVVAAAIGTFAAVLALARMAASPDMSLLYAGLDGPQASEVLSALDQDGATYEVRGDSIFVEASRRDALRMTLAGSGLPSNSGAGYELLDNLSGFGTTSQMFDAAYWRAKEGELARTILASPAVRQARVHIANPAPGPFSRDQGTTASVTLTTGAGSVSETTAEAFRHMVASAVQGLAVGDVAMIDASTGRLIGGDGESSAASLTSDRAATLKANVERLLEARVGAGNAVVELNVETVTQSETIRERRIDPDSRVAISTDVEEITRSEQSSGGAGVTVASNLPEGDGQEGGGSQSQNSENRALTNYDVSETTREVEIQPGAVKRLTVAVLVDSAGLDNGGEAGTDQQLGDLRDLVASAVGFDAERGDTLTLKAMPFEPVEAAGTAATTGPFQRLLVSPLRLLQIAVLALVALGLGIFVLRPILRSKAAEDNMRVDTSLLEGSPRDAIAADPVEVPAASDSRSATLASALEGSASASQGHGPLATGNFGAEGRYVTKAGTHGELPSVTALKQVIEERRPDTIEILRTWLEDDTIEETA